MAQAAPQCGTGSLSVGCLARSESSTPAYLSSDVAGSSGDVLVALGTQLFCTSSLAIPEFQWHKCEACIAV
jgi:hypothetical protein